MLNNAKTRSAATHNIKAFNNAGKNRFIGKCQITVFEQISATVTLQIQFNNRFRTDISLMLHYRLKDSIQLLVDLLGKQLQVCWMFCWTLPPQRGAIISILRMRGGWFTRWRLCTSWDDVLEPSSLESRAASVLVVTRGLGWGLIFWSQACHKSVCYSTGIHDFCFSLPELQNINSQGKQWWQNRKDKQKGIDKTERSMHIIDISSSKPNKWADCKHKYKGCLYWWGKNRDLKHE